MKLDLPALSISRTHRNSSDVCATRETAKGPRHIRPCRGYPLDFRSLTVKQRQIFLLQAELCPVVVTGARVEIYENETVLDRFNKILPFEVREHPYFILSGCILAKIASWGVV